MIYKVPTTKCFKISFQWKNKIKYQMRQDINSFFFRLKKKTDLDFSILSIYPQDTPPGMLGKCMNNKDF